MAFFHHEGAQDSLQAQAHIWNSLFNYINSMCLKCAVELRIPEAIHKHGGEPVTLSQLVAALGLPPDKAAFVGRLMRLLTHSGIFNLQNRDDGAESYLLNTNSEHLLWDNPHSVSAFHVAMLVPSLLNPWQSLSAWLRGDSATPFELFHGTSIWKLAGQKQELNHLFNEAMTSDSRLTMDAAIRDHGEVFRGLKSLVDVGGGSGTTAMTLAEAFPQLKLTVLEMPQVVDSAPEGAGVDFIAGDMFEYVPPADAVLLKWILHDWNDEHCVKLLRVCKEAIPSREEGRKVIIVDMVSDDLLPRESTVTQYFFDMLMMEIPGGKERCEEWRKLFTDAGFSGYKIITRCLGLRAIIELYP